jgi:hypothetical protein
MVVFLFNTVIYVFLLLCLCIFIVCLYIFFVPAGTLRLPWLRFFRAFASVVRQMPGYNSPRQDTARTVPNIFMLFYVFFVLWRSVYLCLNVYCTIATGWQPNCNLTNISYHIVSCHIISHHIIYHIISYIISYRIISYHIISYHIISYHTIPYHIIYHIISYPIIYHNITCIALTVGKTSVSLRVWNWMTGEAQAVQNKLPGMDQTGEMGRSHVPA